MIVSTTARMMIPTMIFFRCGRIRSSSDSPPMCTGLGGSLGFATGSLSAMAGRADVAPATVGRQFAPLDLGTHGRVARSMKLLVVALLALAAPAHAEGERALSASLGWAWFSTPGKAMTNMAPPDVTPDAGGALAVSYEHSIGTDIALRGE